MTAISVIGEIIFKLADFPSTFGTKRGVYWLDAKFGSSSNILDSGRKRVRFHLIYASHPF